MLDLNMQVLLPKEKALTLLKEHLDTVILFSIYLLSFAVPALFGKPQLLIGSVVNFLIASSVFKYGFKKSIPVFFLPSSSALVTGLLFSGATPFIVYLIPFIILSNSLLGLILSKRRDILGVVLGSILKAVFLFVVVNILMEVIGLPKIFLTSMGYIQLITAIIGSTVAYIFSKRLSSR